MMLCGQIVLFLSLIWAGLNNNKMTKCNIKSKSKNGKEISSSWLSWFPFKDAFWVNHNRQTDGGALSFKWVYICMCLLLYILGRWVTWGGTCTFTEQHRLISIGQMNSSYVSIDSRVTKIQEWLSFTGIPSIPFTCTACLPSYLPGLWQEKQLDKNPCGPELFYAPDSPLSAG